MEVAMTIDEHRARIGVLLRALRRSRGMTQQDLSSLIRISRTSVTNIEAGRQAVTTDTLYAIADACGYSLKLQIKPKQES